MNGKTVVLFDLDGTLTDPELGITKSVQYALKHYGIEIDDLKSLRKCIGPPLKQSFMEFFGFDEVKAEEAIERYREYFSKYGIYENDIFDGIRELLEELCHRGKKVVLATSKPRVFAEEILKHFGIEKYFSFLSGSEFDGTRGEKGEVIEYALSQMGVTDKSSAVLVGDRKFDVIGAIENGISCIGVLFGYGDREELEEAGADEIAEDMEELRRILLEDI